MSANFFFTNRSDFFAAGELLVFMTPSMTAPVRWRMKAGEKHSKQKTKPSLNLSSDHDQWFENCRREWNGRHLSDYIRCDVKLWNHRKHFLDETTWLQCCKEAISILGTVQFHRPADVFKHVPLFLPLSVLDRSQVAALFCLNERIRGAESNTLTKFPNDW